MHPLELFDRFRRWFGWVAPGRQMWERKPEQVAPDRSDDWLLEPPSLDEARLLFPHCLLYTSPSPRDQRGARMPSSA